MAQPVLASSIYILHGIYFSYKELTAQIANLRLADETKLAAPRPQRGEAELRGASRLTLQGLSPMHLQVFQEANRSNSGTNDLARLKAHLSIRVDLEDRCSSH